MARRQQGAVHALVLQPKRDHHVAAADTLLQVGPRTLVPPDLAPMGVRVCHELEEGLRDCDVVITLRLQTSA